MEFSIGDESMTCTPDELVPFVEGESDPIDDVGPCHHIETTLGTLTVDATLHYEIEVRRQLRYHRSQPWPDTAWRPHPTRPTVTLDLPANVYDVREILALNVNG